ncbi:MAG: substrate-binding domain-containing protein [Bacteroidetes bacterium]|nr:substrate-binding domain-containing protein [Bacteroidota bacterium]MBS1739526.1 substrate-binding domain-containing protein [Bacteroidota bacterium]
MQRLKQISVSLLLASFLAACSNNEPMKPTDTLSSGNIHISVDESYRPIIEDEINVFDSSFPEAHIKVSYKPESECIKDFLNDSVRLVLVTRELLPDEKKYLADKKVVPTSLAVAKDAVAIVVNTTSMDTSLSKEQLVGILTGKYERPYTVVFDNQGSSTLRYILDSLIPGQKLGTNVYAAKSSDSVIDYVAKNPKAMGFVGVSYVSDFSDPQGLAFIKKVKVCEVLNEKMGKTYKPYQAYIAPNWYPLTRNLYYIHRETYPGLGTGFANFLTRERGQLIFKQSRLFPLRADVIIRNASINP